jgi:hypothetical protein
MQRSPWPLLALALAGTLVVGPGGFAQIQAAVDDAQPGDTMLMKTRGYQEFTVKDKGLVITGDTGVNDPLLPIAGGVFLPDVTAAFYLTAGTLGPGGLQLQLPIQSVAGVTLQLYAQALLVSSAAAGGIVFSSDQGIAILAAGL